LAAALVSALSSALAPASLPFPAPGPLDDDEEEDKETDWNEHPDMNTDRLDYCRPLLRFVDAREDLGNELRLTPTTVSNRLVTIFVKLSQKKLR